MGEGLGAGGQGSGVMVSFITEPGAIEGILDHLRFSPPVRPRAPFPLEFLWDGGIFPIEFLLETQ